jgi:hypothetical protein
LRAHRGERSADDLPTNEGVRADNYADSSELRVRHVHPVSQRINSVGDFEFVDFPVMQEHFAG